MTVVSIVANLDKNDNTDLILFFDDKKKLIKKEFVKKGLVLPWTEGEVYLNKWVPTHAQEAKQLTQEILQYGYPFDISSLGINYGSATENYDDAIEDREEDNTWKQKYSHQTTDYDDTLEDRDEYGKDEATRRREQKKRLIEQEKGQKQEKIVQDLKEQLAVASDITQNPIDRADTPERQAKAEELVIARRQAEVMNRITRKILSGGDKALEERMAQTTDQAKLSALYREAYAKLSDDDKKLCAKIGKETGAMMTKAKDTLEKERRFLRNRRRAGHR